MMVHSQLQYSVFVVQCDCSVVSFSTLFKVRLVRLITTGCGDRSDPPAPVYKPGVT